MPSSTHKLTRTWQEPCVVVQKNFPYSYIIEFDGKRQWSHTNIGGVRFLGLEGANSRRNFSRGIKVGGLLIHALYSVAI
jgi:hypothetical protein